MNIFQPSEIVNIYSTSGQIRAGRKFSQTFVLAIMAGIILALTAAGTSYLASGFESLPLRRLVTGLIFPFGLSIIGLLGAELFTGNCLLVIPLQLNKISIGAMCRNLVTVYLGNLVGSLLIVLIWVRIQPAGQATDVYRQFITGLGNIKYSLSGDQLLLSAILCNVLITTAVLCSLTSKDPVGKVVGSFLPVSLFIFGGYEHCVANMFYLPLDFVLTGGRDVGQLVLNFLIVTTGNMIGGTILGIMFLTGAGHVKNQQGDKNDV